MTARPRPPDAIVARWVTGVCVCLWCGSALCLYGTRLCKLCPGHKGIIAKIENKKETQHSGQKGLF